MPAWIHEREKHIKEKNPNMPESEAWAISTLQSHASGHSPKDYGTEEARIRAKKKYPNIKHAELLDKIKITK